MVAANTEALLADSDPLVGCDSLDEDDFLAEIGKEWKDPEFLAGAKSFKANGNDRQRRFPRISTLTYSAPRSSPERKSRKDYGSSMPADAMITGPAIGIWPSQSDSLAAAIPSWITINDFPSPPFPDKRVTCAIGILLSASHNLPGFPFRRRPRR